MVKDRIKAFCKSQNITVISFEESIGVSNGYVNAISKSVGIDKINAIVEKFSNLNIEWLLTGKGAMLKNDTAIPSEATVQPIHQPRSPEKKMETQSINLYDFKATAGLRELLDNRHANIIDTIKIPNLPKCDGAIHIIGDSMYPRLRPGDIIFYKELPIDLQSILYGEMYLLSYCIDGDDYCVVKYIKRSDKGEPFITLASHNPAHEDTDIDFRCVNAIALIKGSYNQTTMS
ncbi:XRE family transcriptional regulator [Prevotella intermedia]|uniref:Transcriptional regulator n=1 Tax=Prevotella intermedia TaxID=28131 RepID=A0A2M8TWF3_PREIN|nr:XRE family transcriptional regulator [Prevotella intermedia]PJI28248.1 transcriptional regulator [Prevotella intermedia]